MVPEGTLEENEATARLEVSADYQKRMALILLLAKGLPVALLLILFIALISGVIRL